MLEHHSISKSSKHHSTISFETYNKLPQVIKSEITNYCKSHGREYENYCPSHEKMCCPECISVDHKKCSGLQLLKEVIKNVNMADFLDSVTLSVNDIKKQIKPIKEDRELNLKRIQNAYDEYKDDVKKVRDKINSNFDILEKQLEDEKSKIESNMKLLTLKLSDKTKDIDEYEQALSAMKEYVTDLQKYIGGKKIAAKVEEEREYLTSLFKDRCLNQISLRLKIDKALLDIESTLNCFGTVTTSVQEPLLYGMESQKNKQAHVLSDNLQEISDC